MNARLKETARSIAAGLPAPSRIYLTGCGDSLNAGMATQLTWEELLSVPVEAIPAMTFARYAVDTAPRDAWVIALSQSGTVNRVVEAVRAAHKRGITTVTITARPDSPLGVEPTSARFDLDFSKLGFVPGTTSYAVALLAYLELATALAPTHARSAAIQASIAALPQAIEETIQSSRPIAEQHAAIFDRDSLALILAAGPELATAYFTARKLYEVPQVVALVQETEEYAHDAYSIVDATTRVMMYAPPDRGWERYREILGWLRNLGANVAFVSDRTGAEKVETIASVTYAVASTDPALAPIVYAIPSEILCYEVAKRIGGSFYASADPTHRRDGDRQIYGSAVVV